MQKDAYFNNYRGSLASNSGYVSCIRIAGLPILPPLITNDTRKLLLKYKQEAIAKELKWKQMRSQLQPLGNNSINADVESSSDASLVEHGYNQTSDSSGIFTRSVDSSNQIENTAAFQLSHDVAPASLSERRVGNLLPMSSSSETSPEVNQIKSGDVNSKINKRRLLKNCQNKLRCLDNKFSNVSSSLKHGIQPSLKNEDGDKNENVTPHIRDKMTYEVPSKSFKERNSLDNTGTNVRNYLDDSVCEEDVSVSSINRLTESVEKRDIVNGSRIQYFDNSFKGIVDLAHSDNTYTHKSGLTSQNDSDTIVVFAKNKNDCESPEASISDSYHLSSLFMNNGESDCGDDARTSTPLVGSQNDGIGRLVVDNSLNCSVNCEKQRASEKSVVTKENRNLLYDSMHSVLDKSHNLSLSPCRDLVLRCDIFSAINAGRITTRSQEVKENVEVYPTRDELLVRSESSIGSLVEVSNHNKGVSSTNVKDFKTPPKLVRQNSYTLDSPSPELLAFLGKQMEVPKHAPETLKRTYTWTVINNSESSRKKSENFKPFYKCNSIKKARKNWNVEEAKQQWNKKKFATAISLNERSDVCGSQGKRKQKRVESISPVKGPRHSEAHTDLMDCVLSSVNTSPTLPVKALSIKKASPGNRTKIPLLVRSPVASGCLNIDCKDCKLSRSFAEEVVGKKSPSRTSVMVSVTAEKDVSDSCYGSVEMESVYHSPPQVLSKSHDSFMSPSTTSIAEKRQIVELLEGSSTPDPNLNYTRLQHLHKKQIAELLHQQEDEMVRLSKALWSPASSSESQSSLHQSTEKVSLSLTPTRLSCESTSLTSPRARTPCSRRLEFNRSPTNNAKSHSEKEKKAATIITAYVKGFLVRKLFKTDKVLNAIKAIIDSLQCVLNLDKEVNLTHSDVELRERLIIQIESSIHAFHDIFNLPAVDKMAIISADRAKKKKLSRVTPNERPVLSTATQRLIMRKQQMTSEKVTPKSQPYRKSMVTKKAAAQRKKRALNTTDFIDSSTSQPQHQTVVRMKSLHIGVVDQNKKPWK